MTPEPAEGDLPWLTQGSLPVETYQIVDAEGEYDPADVPDLDDEQLRALYRWMRVEQRFAERMVSLQRRGEMGTIGSGRGHEASIVGSGFALDGDDWLIGMGRELTAMFIQGASMRDMILYWRGIEDASRYLAQENCMIAISIGGHLPMVTGLAWGMDLAGDDAVAMAHFGDGATSTGASHEAMNLAGVLNVPAVFYCQNNQWAISVPFERQTNATTLAQRALGYGLPGIRVDGNDVLAVYEAVREARALARQGRPALVEALTYRVDAHTTSDDPSTYRTDEEVDEWREKDPIDRYRRFLEAEGLWADLDDDAIVEEIDAEFDAALAEANAFEERGPGALFEYVYEELPPRLARQLADFEVLLEERPELADHIELRPKG